MPEVEVMLDERRRTLTRTDGSYVFPNVPRGKHRIAVTFQSRRPFFFTTSSTVEVDESATVNFGIGYSLSGLMGQVLNDAGQGVAGVTVAIRSAGSGWTAATGADGSFFVSSLIAGEYDVKVDEDSLPAGYSAESLAGPERVTVGASSPGKAAITVRAYRSIAGRVLTYDPRLGRYVPVAGVQVILREPGLAIVTDLMGRYLFRDLPAGAYTISVPDGAETSTRTVRLGAQPIDLINVDFQISRSGPQYPLVPAVLPVRP